jgi:8-oxo-dGTP diphosphatase
VEDVNTLVEPLSALCAKYNAQLQLNIAPTVFAPGGFPKVGLHLNAHELMRCNTRPVAADVLLGVSCHNELELAQAQKIGVDYLLLSPVKRTLSHPERAPIGWDKFAQLIEPVAIPVYALGGMKEADMVEAIAQGAQGIAAISEWWD